MRMFVSLVVIVIMVVMMFVLSMLMIVMLFHSSLPILIIKLSPSKRKTHPYYNFCHYDNDHLAGKSYFALSVKRHQ